MRTPTESILTLLRDIDSSDITLAFDYSKPSQNDITHIDKQLFTQAAIPNLGKRHYTLDEIQQFYQFLTDHLIPYAPDSTVTNTYSVLNFIADEATAMLEQNERTPMCRFSKVFLWLDISFALGQDLLTTAYIAQSDAKIGQHSYYFAWPPIIKTNNHRLNNILKKGIAENHFHLNGSSQIFTINWICAMNYIGKLADAFSQIDYYLTPHMDSTVNSRAVPSLYNKCKEAAMYRVFLFERLRNPEQSTDEALQCYKDYCKLDVMGQVTDYHFSLLDNLQNHLYTMQKIHGFSEHDFVFDYALTNEMISINNNYQRILAGERKFLYDCYYASFTGQFSYLEQNMFYKYLNIRTHFRNELVQVNQIDGFANFCLYQDRKTLFVDAIPSYEDEFYKLAINSNLECENIKSLEARIAPADTPEKLYEKIKKYQKAIKDNKEFENKLFYVIHFIKQPDKKENRNSCFLSRHHQKRLQIAEQANAIRVLLEKKPEMRKLIKGIDAANAEIVCPPEVFACAYRMLLQWNYETKPQPTDCDVYSVNLMATYHVGEDFLDIASGLRAIDETMLFLNYRRNHRLGHALALGIKPHNYYSLKKNVVRMPNQELLDNTVWIIEKCKEFGIVLNDGLRTKLERKFHELFTQIYLVQENSSLEISNTSTLEYFNGWMLRGDHPDLYKITGEEFTQNIERINNTRYQTPEYFYINRVVDETIRNNTKYQHLYYAYHFSPTTKKMGAKISEWQVDSDYIKIVEQLQNRMIQKISQDGIGIECNPSSNYLIGTILRYDEHPLFHFNSYHLKEQDYPLFVSINTDDQGVFDTLLENEYALIAKALEEMKDEDGNPLYSIEQIYSYIDYIRNLGMEQSFSDYSN